MKHGLPMKIIAKLSAAEAALLKHLDQLGADAVTTSPWPIRPLAERGRLLSGGTPSKANAAYWEE